MKKRWIKFNWLPASWGLSGDAYDEAEANYYLEGEELDRKLLNIRYRLEPEILEKKLLDLSLRNKKITQYEYDIQLNEMENIDVGICAINQIDIDVKHKKITEHEGSLKKIDLLHKEDSVEKQLAILEAEYTNKKIENRDYEKKKSILKNEPWAAFVNSGFDPDKGIEGFYFELDWNPQWIEYLRLHGYVGHTDEQLIEEWLADLFNEQKDKFTGNIDLTQYPMGYTDV